MCVSANATTHNLLVACAKHSSVHSQLSVNNYQLISSWLLLQSAIMSPF